VPPKGRGDNEVITAIYVRKSSEQNVSDEEKSVTRQIDHGRAYAERKGWTVDDAHVYADDGISGAEFVKRCGLNALLAMIRQRPCPVQALVTMEVSRLGREQTETAVVVREILRAGVRLFTYADRREITQDSALDKFSLSALNFVAEMERELSRTRTREAMRSKASRGHVAGGKVYGYRNVRHADHVSRVVDQAEAAIVRRIFEEIAAGRGFARVAQRLNAEGIPCPRAGRGWAMTGVRAIVFRELYRGRVVYGQTRWVDRGGTKVKADCPSSEWLMVDAPDLRIVDEELWTAAHARLERTRQTYSLHHRRPSGRPEAGIESRHLLSGFVVCGACGGSMHAIRRTSRRGAARVYYVCNGWRVNGTCGNSWSLHLEDLDALVLAALHEDVLTPDLVDDVVNRAVELSTEQSASLSGRREALEGDLRRVEAELARLAEAVAGGDSLPTLMDAMRARERRRADLRAQLEHVDGLARAGAPVVTASLRASLEARLTSWSDLLVGNPLEARPILRKLLDGRLTATPKNRRGGRWYEITGQAVYGPLLAGVVGLVPPG
jgi:site-specific DNA recombinase